MQEISVTVQQPDASALRSQTSAFSERSALIVIDSEDDYDFAVTDIKAIKAKYKELDTQKKTITRPLDAAKKAAMDVFREPLQFLTNAEKGYKAKMLVWTQKKAREQREAQARREELARKEREKLEARAEKARQKGKEEYAEALEAQVDATHVVDSPLPPKAQGISTRVGWEAVVTDKAALIAAVAQGLVPPTVLQVDMTVLNQMARALKKEMQYPGVEVREKRIMGVRL